MSTTSAAAFTGGVAGKVGGVTDVFQNAFGSLGRSFNILFPPAQREALKAKASKFATEKPYLASFLLAQIALSGLPLILFGIMTITVAIFALLAGLLVGLLGAVFFILAAVGVALVVLLPTLFFTTFAAVAVWLWGMGAYYIIKWFNQKEVPGIHKPLMDGIKPPGGVDQLQRQVASSAPQPFASKMDTINKSFTNASTTSADTGDQSSKTSKADAQSTNDSSSTHETSTGHEPPTHMNGSAANLAGISKGVKAF